MSFNLKFINNDVFKILESIIVILFGFAIIFRKSIVYSVYDFSIALLITYYIFELLVNIFKRNRKNYFRTIAQTIINVVLCIVLKSNYLFVQKSIYYFYIFYLLFMILTDFINVVIFISNKFEGIINMIIRFIMVIVIFVLALNNSDNNIIDTIFGLYFIIYGLSELISFVSDYDRHIAIPIFIAMFIPKLTLKKIYSDMKSNKLVRNRIKNEDTDLSIIIHLADGGTASFGHIEIAIGNTLYSYGNYNEHSQTFFGCLGDGVLMKCNKNKYIREQTFLNGRYLVEFGLKASDEQLKTINEFLNELFINTERIYSDLELSEQGKLPAKKYRDAPSEMHFYADAKYYRIKNGKYKTFFVFNTNCTMLPESILKILGLEIKSVNGILAPGSYYDFLSRNYDTSDSQVVSIKIHTRNDYTK